MGNKFISYLLGCNSFSQVRDNSSEEPIMSRQTDEELEFIVLAKTVASSLDARDQSGVHPAMKHFIVMMFNRYAQARSEPHTPR